METPYIEANCVFEHDGRKFEAGGAVVTAALLIAYPSEHGQLKTWHGEVIGTWRVLSTWRTPRSHYSSTMSSIEAFVAGVRYVGRGAGSGMILRAKRSPKQSKLARIPA